MNSTATNSSKRTAQPEGSAKTKRARNDGSAATSKSRASQSLQPLSFAEQLELSDRINLLPASHLPRAMEILRGSSNIDEDAEEVDVDIDQLDVATQRKLHHFVLVRFCV